MDSTANFIFLPKVPLMNPRTLWACHPVSSIMFLSVAPPGRFSRSRTWAVLLPTRVLISTASGALVLRALAEGSGLGALPALGALTGLAAGVACLLALAFTDATAGACGAASRDCAALAVGTLWLSGATL